jgi:hypothetical protein
MAASVIAQSGLSPALVTESKATRFFENRGQWDSRAIYMAQLPGLGYWVTRDGVVLDAFKTVTRDNGEIGVEGHVVEMRFVGSTGALRHEAREALPGRTDFFVGPRERHARGVRSFRESMVYGIYPNIDARHYFDGDRARYDLIVQPGGDPRRVRMRFEAADAVRITEDGDLEIVTRVGVIKNAGLFSYQEIDGEKIPVPSRFVQIDANTVGIRVESFDRRHALVIDPLVYGTNFGGTGGIGMNPGFDTVEAITNDRDAGVYLTGSTASPNFPINRGFYDRVSMGGALDAYLTKFSGDSYEIVYSVYIGGGTNDVGRGIAIDSEGNNLYLVGTTNSATFPGTEDGVSFRTTRTGTVDLFLVRFQVDAFEQLIPAYVTFYGATGRTMTYAGMGVGPISGRVYVAGHVNGSGLPPTSRFNTFLGGSNDTFLVTFDTFQTGDDFVPWGRYIGGSGTDNVGGMAISPVDETIAVTGTILFSGNQDTASEPSPRFETTVGVFENGRLLRNNDAFITKYDQAGNRVWAALLGGSNADAFFIPGGSNQPPPPLDSPSRVAIDPEGSIYVSTVAHSFNYPRTRGVFRETFTDAPTVALTKISGDGSTILWSTSMSTTRRVYPNSLSVDSRGITNIVGTVLWDDPPPPGGPTLPGSIPTTEDGLQREYEGGDRQFPVPMGEPRSTADAFVLTLSANGSTLLYGSYIGTASEELGHWGSVDRANSLYIGGSSVAVPILGAFGLPGVYLSSDALKRSVDAAGGDGFFIKLRVRLPILDAIQVAPSIVSGGLGVQSQVAVFLRDPAPPEGVEVTITSSNALVASFSQNSAVPSTTVNIPGGVDFAVATVFSQPVQNDTPVRLTARYDDNVKAAVLTVRPWLLSVTTNSNSVVGGNTLLGRITLSSAAPSGGVVVNLRSSNSAVASVPSTVTVPQGQLTANFTVTSRGVSSTQVVRITGQFLGATKTQNIRVVPASLESLRFNPDPVLRGELTTATVSLNGAAGSNLTLEITQTGGPGLIDLPATVQVPQNSRTATFTVRAPFVGSTGVATVRARNLINSQSVTGTVTIDADTEEPNFTVRMSPDFVYGGSENATGLIQLSAPAPIGGLTFTLSSSDSTKLTVPQSVRVNAGETTATFNTTSARVNDDVRLFVTAARPSGITAQDDLWVLAPALRRLVMNPNVVSGGQSSVGTVELFAPAPAGGVTVTLQSSSGAATVPGSVFIPANLSSVSFTATTVPVSEDRVATITGTFRASSASATLTIRTARLIGLDLNPRDLPGGAISVATVTLDQPAPAGGIVVNLSSSNSSLVTLPSTVTIPGGARNATFQIQTQRVSRDSSVEIYAQVAGQQRLSAVLFIRR